VSGLCNDDSDQGDSLSPLHERVFAGGRALALVSLVDTGREDRTLKSRPASAPLGNFCKLVLALPHSGCY
jgi:hypothetical protein